MTLQECLSERVIVIFEWVHHYTLYLHPSAGHVLAAQRGEVIVTS